MHYQAIWYIRLHKVMTCSSSYHIANVINKALCKGMQVHKIMYLSYIINVNDILIKKLHNYIRAFLMPLLCQY